MGRICYTITWINPTLIWGCQTRILTIHVSLEDAEYFIQNSILGDQYIPKKVDCSILEKNQEWVLDYKNLNSVCPDDGHSHPLTIKNTFSWRTNDKGFIIEKFNYGIMNWIEDVLYGPPSLAIIE